VVQTEGRLHRTDTWYHGDGTPFQPQVHYFVGGATKLDGAALYRLRPEAFPEQLNPPVAAPGWRPEFDNYLYLGFTNATAFSPTDVMPLARWAKLAMTLQALASL